MTAKLWKKELTNLICTSLSLALVLLSTWFFAVHSLSCYENVICTIAATREKKIVGSMTFSTNIMLDYVPLRPLSLESIKEYLENSFALPSKAHVGEILCWNNDILLQPLAELLFEFNKGIPGLLASTVDVLLEYALRQNEPCL